MAFLSRESIHVMLVFLFQYLDVFFLISLQVWNSCYSNGRNRVWKDSADKVHVSNESRSAKCPKHAIGEGKFHNLPNMINLNFRYVQFYWTPSLGKKGPLISPLSVGQSVSQ